jgi:hypothetical protein
MLAARIQGPEVGPSAALDFPDLMTPSSQGGLPMLDISAHAPNEAARCAPGNFAGVFIDVRTNQSLSKRFKEGVINVTVAPFFARLKGLDDRMLRLLKVLRGVFVLRRVAAADVPAYLTQA